MKGKTERRITEERKQIFLESLIEDEKSRATIEKYKRDLEKLEAYLQGKELSKEKLVIEPRINLYLENHSTTMKYSFPLFVASVSVLDIFSHIEIKQNIILIFVRIT